MFDIGFLELGLIGVVALLVIGPERLPSVARTVGNWVGRARRFISHMQTDIKQELSKTDELKRLLEEQAKIKDVHEIIESTVDEVKGTVPAKSVLEHSVKSFDSGEAEPASKTKAVNEQTK